MHFRCVALGKETYRASCKLQGVSVGRGLRLWRRVRPSRALLAKNPSANRWKTVIVRGFLMLVRPMAVNYSL